MLLRKGRYYGAYIQDDWKALPRLTVNLGLRYDLDIPRTERHNRMEAFNPTVASPLAETTGITGLSGGVVFRRRKWRQSASVLATMERLWAACRIRL